MRAPRETFDVVVVGGGPAGATAAHELAARGLSVVLLDRAGRIKPCGGAVPPQLLSDFAIPSHLVVNRIGTARIVSPRGEQVDIPIRSNFVGMVDRDVFDEWLRDRAHRAGAVRITGRYLDHQDEGDTLVVRYGRGASQERGAIRCRRLIGADGALSAVARAAIPESRDAGYVFAYHEVLRAPGNQSGYDDGRCDVIYRGSLSPDFYAWIFPHGETVSVGTGSMRRGFSLKGAVGRLRRDAHLDRVETIRREGAPIPLRPLARWDNGRNVVLAGDAAGVVAPASGEGIFYAMTGGRLAAEGVAESLGPAGPRALARVRRRFLREHGAVFRVLDLMQRFWYRNDGRRERFVAICRDPDVQELTFDGYLYKRLVRAKPLAHVRIFVKNIGHLTGLVRV